MALGEEFGVPLPVAEVVKDDLAAAVGDGRGDKGVDGVILSLEEAAHVQVRTAQ